MSAVVAAWVLGAVASGLLMVAMTLARELTRERQLRVMNKNLLDSTDRELTAADNELKRQSELVSAHAGQVVALQAELGSREIRLTGRVKWCDGSPGPAAGDAAMAAFELEQGAGVLGIVFACDGGVILGAVHYDGAGWRGYARLGGNSSGVQWSGTTGTLERAKQEVERMLREYAAHERAGIARGRGAA